MENKTASDERKAENQGEIIPKKEGSDGPITDGITMDKSIFGGKCKYCGGRIIVNPGLGFTQEVCASCGRPYVPETFGG